MVGLRAAGLLLMSSKISSQGETSEEKMDWVLQHKSDLATPDETLTRTW